MSGAVAIAVDRAPGCAGHRLALMQPYLFPHLGSYQLARAVDEYVFYDDAAFMKQSYLQRNHVLLGGVAHRFSAPVGNASSFRSIREHRFIGPWDPLLKLLRAAYAKAPQFGQVMPLIERVLRDPDDNVARKNALSMTAVFDYLGLRQRWSWSSDHPAPSGAARGQDRVLALCLARGATTYLNAPGGRALYDAAAFAARGLTLRFIEPNCRPYAQPAPGFVPNLSIIDLLMQLSPAEIVRRLDDYTLAV